MARPARVVSHRKRLVVGGVDLAGSPRRPTGVCILRGLQARTHVAFADEEILNLIDRARPDLVPIDAPLTLPYGCRTIHDRAGRILARATANVIVDDGLTDDSRPGIMARTQDRQICEKVCDRGHRIGLPCR